MQVACNVCVIMAFVGASGVGTMTARGQLPNDSPDAVVTSDVASELPNGPMQAAASTIRKVLRLKLTEQGTHLELDRSAWKSSGNDLANAIEDKITLLRRRGLDPAKAERLAKQMAKSVASGPLSDLFGEFRLQGMSSVGKSQMGGISKTFCQGPKINCTATFTDTSFEFEVVETQGQRLNLFSTDDRLRIVFIYEDVIAILNQSNTGNISAVLTGATNSACSADSFKQLREEHPALCSQIETVLIHAGVDFPPSPTDETVRQRVLLRIRKLNESTQQGFDALTQQLNANEFELRESASEKIVAQFDRFESLIVRELATDTLPLEARKRLEKILDRSRNQTPADSRIDQCIERNKLLGSPTYLVGLLDELDSDDQVLVTGILRGITQEDFGRDIAAWKAWAKRDKSDDGSDGTNQKKD